MHVHVCPISSSTVAYRNNMWFMSVTNIQFYKYFKIHSKWFSAFTVKAGNSKIELLLNL